MSGAISKDKGSLTTAIIAGVAAGVVGLASVLLLVALRQRGRCFGVHMNAVVWHHRKGQATTRTSKAIEVDMDSSKHGPAASAASSTAEAG